MSKSIARQRRDYILSRMSLTQQAEARTEEAMGRPEKMNRLIEICCEAKALYPKPGGPARPIASEHRVSVLKALVVGHGAIAEGAIYEREAGPITRAVIEAYLDQISDAVERELAWLDYLEDRWHPDHALVQSLAAAESLSSQQVLDLFDLAVTLRRGQGES